MDVVDRVICKLCPFVAGGIFIGSVYWTAVTYGAVTVMQVGINSSYILILVWCCVYYGEYELKNCKLINYKCFIVGSHI